MRHLSIWLCSASFKHVCLSRLYWFCNAWETKALLIVVWQAEDEEIDMTPDMTSRVVMLRSACTITSHQASLRRLACTLISSMCGCGSRA